jgi:leucyl/phenylalanyl-tRNA--protein transferase
MTRAVEITPALLLKAYAHGYFPMAETADSDRLFWLDPPMRGILPLDAFHVPRRLRRTLRQGVRSGTLDIRFDHAFSDVIAACAERRPDRLQTWINADILRLYGGLHDMGHAHSVELWCDNRLAGGLYGVALGGAFFGESMFSRQRDASKVALVCLVAMMRVGGFTLLDTQFTTDHLARFGGLEVPQAHYKTMLQHALHRQGTWQPERVVEGLALVLGDGKSGDSAP